MALQFKQDVIHRSFEKPVLVDFWAEWCGPCRVLGPVIEELAEEQKEKWDLVKVNTEEHPDLADIYNIRSIPNVKLFHEGEVIAEFSGALLKSQIELWLEEHLPDKRKTTLEDLESRLEEEGALEELQNFVQQNPDLLEARILLAKHQVFTHPEVALEMVESIKMSDKQYDRAEDIRTLAQLMQFDSDGSSTATLLDQAREALKENAPEKAIKHIIDATAQNKSFQNDLPRKAAIALFRTWGNQDPLTKKYRPHFDMALY